MPSAREERTLRIGWWWWVEKEGWMYGRERNPPREQTDRKEREREEKEKSGIDTREKEEREREEGRECCTVSLFVILAVGALGQSLQKVLSIQKCHTQGTWATNEQRDRVGAGQREREKRWQLKRENPTGRESRKRRELPETQPRHSTLREHRAT